MGFITEFIGFRVFGFKVSQGVEGMLKGLLDHGVVQGDCRIVPVRVLWETGAVV